MACGRPLQAQSDSKTWSAPPERLVAEALRGELRPNVDDELLATAASAAARVLPAGDTDDVFGVGFVIAHQGQHAEWVLVDWWRTGGVLAQHLLWRPCGSHLPPQDAPPHLLACVWELRITSFERDAWIHFILKDPSHPDVDGYLGAAIGDEPSP